jgi:hypothetical protein
MNDFATKNYNSFPALAPLPKNGILRKIKYVAFAALCMATLCGVLATTAEVGVHLQMARVYNHSK